MAIALLVEPIGLLWSMVLTAAVPGLLDSFLGSVVVVAPLLATGVAGVVTIGAGGRFMKHSHKSEGKTYGLQAAQYSVRFGRAGNDVFVKAGFSATARNVQRVLSGGVPVGLLAYFVATG